MDNNLECLEVMQSTVIDCLDILDHLNQKESFIREINKEEIFSMMDSYTPSGVVKKASSAKEQSRSYNEITKYLEESSLKMREANSCLAVLSKVDKKIFLNLSSKIFKKNREFNDSFTGTSNELQASTFLEIMGSEIIWNLGNGSCSEYNDYLDTIMNDKSQKNYLKRLAKWQLLKNNVILECNESLLTNKQKYRLNFSVKDSNLEKYSGLGQTIFSSNNQSKCGIESEDYRILDTNLRNRLPEVSIQEKIEAIEDLWNLKVAKYQYVGGATGALKIEQSLKIVTT